MRFFPGTGVPLALWQPLGTGTGMVGAAPASPLPPAQTRRPTRGGEAGTGRDAGRLGSGVLSPLLPHPRGHQAKLTPPRALRAEKRRWGSGARGSQPSNEALTYRR